jgi:hypothetical protein
MMIRLPWREKYKNNNKKLKLKDVLRKNKNKQTNSKMKGKITKIKQK